MQHLRREITIVQVCELLLPGDTEAMERDRENAPHQYE